MGKYSNEIKAYALKNSLDFGIARAEKILPKLFQHGLLKSEIKEVMPEIKEVVRKVNSLSQKSKKEEFEKYKDYIKEREEKERTLPELPNAKIGKVVMRVAPFPSGALHIGNIRTFILNALYTEKYKGKLYLVFDDTIGSEKKPVTSESYKLIEDAFSWLDIKFDKIVYKSDRMKIYYDYAEKLISKDAAYVCYCTQQELRKNRKEGRACSCRLLPKEINKQRWKEMFKMKEGHATLRIKTSMQHPNPAFRDRVLFKISDRNHPRVGKKYRVWPTLEMSWAIDDHLLGITHILRGMDLMMESEMEKFIWNIFEWKHPEIIHNGLIKIHGAKISKSKSQEEVKSGKYIGWHDPRTWSIQSLGFRGIRPEAIKEFIREIGLTKANTEVPIETLYAINRRIIDKEANRYSFITNPLKLNLNGAPNWATIEVPVHPDKSEKRVIKLGEIFISKEDYEKFKGKEVRLLYLFNVNLKNGRVVSIDNRKPPKINWVGEHVNVRVLMPDGGLVSGIGESAISALVPNDVVQFERFGFVRFDGTKEEEGKTIYEFWFAHK